MLLWHRGGVNRIHSVIPDKWRWARVSLAIDIEELCNAGMTRRRRHYPCGADAVLAGGSEMLARAEGDELNCPQLVHRGAPLLSYCTPQF